MTETLTRFSTRLEKLHREFIIEHATSNFETAQQWQHNYLVWISRKWTTPRLPIRSRFITAGVKVWVSFTTALKRNFLTHLVNAASLSVKPCDCGFNTGEKPQRCKKEDCEAYPYYGVAPHDSGFDDGQFIGKTTLDNPHTWPKNFEPDPDDSQCGTYYCPECRRGM